MMSVWTNKSFVHLLGFAMAFDENYSSFWCAPMRSHECSMHTNLPLLDIICQSHAFLCIHYGPELVFVRDLPIPCIFNGLNWKLSEISPSCEFTMYELIYIYESFLIAPNWRFWDVSYSKNLAPEYSIISIRSLRIGPLMPYYFHHNSPIWNLNSIFYWKLDKLLLGGITVEKLNKRLWEIFYYLHARFTTPNEQPFLTFVIFPP